MPGTFETTQVGKREDLADLIAIADAKNTPFTSLVRKGKTPTNTLFEWQADRFAPAKTSGTAEGADVENYENAAEYRQKLSGRLQKFRRTVMVTTEAEEISNVAGINSSEAGNVAGATEFARAKAKKAIEIKRDIESTLLSANDSRPEATGQPRLTRGLGSWISNTAQTDLPVPEDFRTPAASLYTGAIGSFTEDSLKGLMQSRWNQTGTTDELTLICGSAVKDAITDFIRYEPNKASNANVRTYFFSQEKKVQSVVDVYEGDYGMFEIFLNSFMPNARVGYLLDMRLVELRAAFMPRYKDLPDLGAGKRGMIEAIVGLAVANPLGQAEITATT